MKEGRDVLTDPQADELRRLSREPQGTSGRESARARVQNGLVQLGMAAYEDDGALCVVTAKGREALAVHDAQPSVRRLQYWGGRICEAESDERAAEERASALRHEVRTLDWKARRDWDNLSYNDVQRRYALPELIAAAEREVHHCRSVLADRWLNAKRWWREEKQAS